MANVPFTFDNISRTVTWTPITGAGSDAGNSFEIQHTDCTVHVLGTFSGTTVTMQGSNDPRAELGNANYASAEWFILEDNTGTNIAVATATDGKVVSQSPRFIRPVAASGTGSLTVILSKKGSR